MKNIAYLSTALYAIFLANLSPCHAMQFELDAQDAQGKTIHIQLPTTSEPTLRDIRRKASTDLRIPLEDLSVEVLVKSNKVFDWSDDQMIVFNDGVFNALLEKKYSEAHQIINEILNNPRATGNQKDHANLWKRCLDEQENVQQTQSASKELVAIMDDYVRNENMPEVRKRLQAIADNDQSPYKENARTWVKSLPEI